MNITTIKNAITSRAGRQLLIINQKSPAILFVVGVAGVVATVVVASRATLKLDDVMTESEEKLDLVKNYVGPKYSDEDRRRDIILIHSKTFGRIAKLYAPALALGALSVGCLTGSHIILNRRNVALTAAYSIVDRSFREYRKRVIDELGMDKDEEFRFGTVEKDVILDTKDGPIETTIKTVDKSTKSMYSFMFDEVNNKNYSKNWGYNQTFLAAQQLYAQTRLRARGYLFLNDVLDSLGFDRVPHGQLVGWLADPKKFGRTGDEYVDFGLGDTRDSSIRFVDGNERAVRLDFNVDGNILDFIARAAR